MSAMLPTKLGKTPLLDAVFEARLVAKMPLSNILPGVLFTGLGGEARIEKLPTADIPSQLREADPNFKYAPVIVIHSSGYRILLSDHSIIVASAIPYVGWGELKSLISKVFTLVKEVGVVSGVERCSLKYVNFISNSEKIDFRSFLKLNISLGSHSLSKEVFQMRVEMPFGKWVNVVQVLSSAVVNRNAGAEEGFILDIDTIRNMESIDFNGFVGGLDGYVDELHDSLKSTFFDCLSESALAYLEPSYD